MLPLSSKTLSNQAAAGASQGRLLVIGMAISLLSASLGYAANPGQAVSKAASAAQSAGPDAGGTGTTGGLPDGAQAGSTTGTGGLSSPGDASSGTQSTGTSPGGNASGTSGTTGTGAGSSGVGSTSGSGGSGTPMPSQSCSGKLSCGPLTASDQGVTAASIKLGFLIPNTSQLSAAGINAGVSGNQQKIITAWTNELNRLKVNGRKVSVVSQTFDVLSAADQQAACKSLTQDQKVFGILSPGGYDSVGQLCVSKENHTPFIGTDPEPSQWYQDAKPYLYSTFMNKDRIMRNNAKWLQTGGYLRSTDKVGLVYHDIPNLAPSVEKTYLPALKAAGINVEVIKLASDSQQGLAQVTTAVNQFKRDKVTFVIPVMNLIYKSKFQQDAGQQGYKPRYDESDIYFGCSEFTTAAYDRAGQFNRTRCLTSTDNTQYTRAMKKPTQWVVYATDVYKRTYPDGYGNGGDDPTAQAGLNLSIGTLFMLWYHAADRAGTQLTRPRWGQGMQATGTVVQQIGYCSMTFGPGKFDGSDFLSVSEFHHEASSGYPADTFHTVKPCFRNYF